MAFSKNSEFAYSFGPINRIIEEKGNQFIRFAQISWTKNFEDADPSKIKYDLRKYTTDADGNEKMLKGVSFLTDNGPSELVHVLTEEGFGKTTTILDNISKRDDFKDSIQELKNGGNSEVTDELFDLRDILD